MKIQSYEFPHSSFLSVEKDLNLILSQMLKNQRFLKLLYYPTKDCLSKPRLSQDQALSLVGDDSSIRITPWLEIVPEVKSFVCIGFDTFAPNTSNPEFRNNTIVFTIQCHRDVWFLKDFQLRPYKIAAELDSMFADKSLTGIGQLKFAGATFAPIDKDYAGIVITYLAIHGGEDKVRMPNPIDEEGFIKDFNETFNEE